MKIFRKNLILLLVSLILLTNTSCGYNKIQEADESVKASWAQVLNVYKRRFDLIPNLVSVVQAYAKHEKETLMGVTQARAQVGSIKLTPELLNDPGALANFQAAQSQMTSALSRLMVVVEKYPDLKANENFRDLQAQLEGTENRITVERKRFIDAVQNYNILIRKFPSNLTAKFFDYQLKPTFQPENEKEISEPPKVKFE